MIVETMSFEEIAREYEKALKAHPFYTENLDLAKIRRFFIKNKNATNIFMKPRFYKIDENAKLYYIPFLRNKKCFEEKDLTKLTFMMYRTSNGINVVKRRYNSVIHQTYYTFTSSHFFDRYRERHLKNNDMSKVDVILDFYKTNFRGDQIYIYLDESDGLTCRFFSAYDTGMARGVFESDTICLYKTYIDPSDISTLKKEELDFLNEIKSHTRKSSEELVNQIKSIPGLFNRLREDEGFQSFSNFRE